MLRGQPASQTGTRFAYPADAAWPTRRAVADQTRGECSHAAAAHSELRTGAQVGQAQARAHGPSFLFDASISSGYAPAVAVEPANAVSGVPMFQRRAQNGSRSSGHAVCQLLNRVPCGS